MLDNLLCRVCGGKIRVVNNQTFTKRNGRKQDRVFPIFRCSILTSFQFRIILSRFGQNPFFDLAFFRRQKHETNFAAVFFDRFYDFRNVIVIRIFRITKCKNQIDILPRGFADSFKAKLMNEFPETVQSRIRKPA